MAAPRTTPPTTNQHSWFRVCVEMDGVPVFTPRPAALNSGLVTALHATWTPVFLALMFMLVFGAWFGLGPISCVSLFNAETLVALETLIMCSSKPYVEDSGQRRYLSFYQWVPVWLLLLTVIYIIVPRIGLASLDFSPASAMIYSIQKTCTMAQSKADETLQKVTRFISLNVGLHNGLYWRAVMLTGALLLLDVVLALCLNTGLQGNFFHTHINTTDAFPPVAACEISDYFGKRIERFNCHLTAMGTYENVFYLIWLWFILLVTVCCIQLAFLGLMLIPAVQPYLVWPFHGQHSSGEIVRGVCRQLGVGDIFLLHRLHYHLSHASFYHLLSHLAATAANGNNLAMGPVFSASPESVNDLAEVKVFQTGL